MYLLADNEKSTKMREKISAMLLSGELSNLQLALQIIEGGGLHIDFIPALWLNFELYRNEKEAATERKIIKKLFKSHFKGDNLWELFSETVKMEMDWEEQLNYLKKSPEMSTLLPSLVIEGLRLLKKGGKFCIEHQILSKKETFLGMIDQGTLDLRDFEIEVLPEELADLKVERIDVRYNPLRSDVKYPWKNNHVQYIDFDTQDSAPLIHHLAGCFPNAYQSFLDKGDFYCSNALSAQRKQDMEKAKHAADFSIHCYRNIPASERDYSYYQNRGQSYINSGRYEMAEVCYVHIRNTYEKYDSSLYNMACNQARLGNKEQMMHFLRQYFKKPNGIFYHIDREYFFSDNDFENYWSDPDFIKIIDENLT